MSKIFLSKLSELTSPKSEVILETFQTSSFLWRNRIDSNQTEETQQGMLTLSLLIPKNISTSMSSVLAIMHQNLISRGEPG